MKISSKESLELFFRIIFDSIGNWVVSIYYKSFSSSSMSSTAKLSSLSDSSSFSRSSSVFHTTPTNHFIFMSLIVCNVKHHFRIIPTERCYCFFFEYSTVAIHQKWGIIPLPSNKKQYSPSSPGTKE